jgi:fatty acid desaturase
MSIVEYFKSLKSPEHRLAWIVAMAADAIQIGGLPFFIEGAGSPADSLLDLVVAFLLIRLLGWHWAFLPSLAAELIPGADLFPTWTAAVWFVTRQRVHSEEPEILPPGPSPAPRS